MGIPRSCRCRASFGERGEPGRGGLRLLFHPTAASTADLTKLVEVLGSVVYTAYSTATDHCFIH